MPFTGPSIGQCELSIKLEQYGWWRWRGLACELNFASRLTRLGERLVFPQIERQLEPKMIEVICNDRLGKKVRVKCNSEDSIGDLKKLIAAQTGTPHHKIVLKKWYTIFKDHVTLGDYEIHDGMNLELYYQ